MAYSGDSMNTPRQSKWFRDAPECIIDTDTQLKIAQLVTALLVEQCRNNRVIIAEQ